MEDQFGNVIKCKPGTVVYFDWMGPLALNSLAYAHKTIYLSWLLSTKCSKMPKIVFYRNFSVTTTTISEYLTLKSIFANVRCIMYGISLTNNEMNSLNITVYYTGVFPCFQPGIYTLG